MSSLSQAPSARFGARKTIVFSLVPVALLLATAEAVIRFTGVARTCDTPIMGHMWVCDPILQFRITPSLHVNGQQVNSLGLRGKELTPKRAGVFRILALGDSCTFGFIALKGGIGDYLAEPYPERLERLVEVRHGPGRVEVVNAGVTGYNTYQGIMLLRTRLRRAAPDLVTVRYGWNDILFSPGPPKAFREPETRLGLAVEDVALRTALYPFALRLGMALRATANDGAPLETLIRPAWTPNIPLDLFRHNLRRIVELSHARGARAWLLTSPDAFTMSQHAGGYVKFATTAQKQLAMLKWSGVQSFDELSRLHQAYNQAIREVGAELGVRVVDLEARYRERRDWNLFWDSDAIHPTQKGHAIEAEALYEELVAEGVLERAPSAATAAGRP